MMSSKTQEEKYCSGDIRKTQHRHGKLGDSLHGSSPCNVPTPSVSNQAEVSTTMSGRIFKELEDADWLRQCDTSFAQRLDVNAENSFGKSQLVARSPVEPTSIREISSTPTSGLATNYGMKRKRSGEDSVEKHLLQKSRCLENQTIATIERLVTKLCNSVAASSNTKKEIRDIISKLRNLVARLVGE